MEQLPLLIQLPQDREEKTKWLARGECQPVKVGGEGVVVQGGGGAQGKEETVVKVAYPTQGERRADSYVMTAGCAHRGKVPKTTLTNYNANKIFPNHPGP